MKEKLHLSNKTPWCVNIRLSPPLYSHIETLIAKLIPPFPAFSCVRWQVKLFAPSQRLSIYTAKGWAISPSCHVPNPILHIASWDIGTSGKTA